VVFAINVLIDQVLYMNDTSVSQFHWIWRLWSWRVL